MTVLVMLGSLGGVGNYILQQQRHAEETNARELQSFKEYVGERFDQQTSWMRSLQDHTTESLREVETQFRGVRETMDREDAHINRRLALIEEEQSSINWEIADRLARIEEGIP